MMVKYEKRANGDGEGAGRRWRQVPQVVLLRLVDGREGGLVEEV